MHIISVYCFRWFSLIFLEGDWFRKGCSREVGIFNGKEEMQGTVARHVLPRSPLMSCEGES